MKIMEDIALFAKYTGMRREVFNLEVNATVFKNFFSEEDCSSKITALDEKTTALLAELKDIVEKHKQLFSEKATLLLDEEGTPTAHMMRMYLLMVYISGGEVVSTFNYLNDLFAALKPTSSEEERMNDMMDFSKQAVIEGYLKPAIDVHTEDGIRVLSADEDVPENSNVGQIRLQLTASGIDLIQKEVTDLEERKKSKTATSTKVFDLMSMPSPSKSLN